MKYYYCGKEIDKGRICDDCEFIRQIIVSSVRNDKFRLYMMEERFKHILGKAS